MLIFIFVFILLYNSCIKLFEIFTLWLLAVLDKHNFQKPIKLTLRPILMTIFCVSFFSAVQESRIETVNLSIHTMTQLFSSSELLPVSCTKVFLDIKNDVLNFI